MCILGPSSGSSSRTFRRHPGDFRVGRLQDVLGTNICWLGSITNLATTAALNAKIKEVKNKIPNITNLGTTTALIAVENKMPNVSNLVKKTDYSTKIENKITADHDHDKCIANQEFKRLTLENFTARLAQVNLASKSDIANFVKKTDLNKNELKELSKKVEAIPTEGLTNDLINLVFLMEYSIVFKIF